MSSNKNINIIKGVSAVIILSLAVGFIIAYFQGLIDQSNLWIILVVAGGVIAFILFGIILLPRVKVQRPDE